MNLFFDLDGTLTDPSEGIVRCYRHALDALGLTAPRDEELTRLIGPPLQASFRGLLGPDREQLVPDAVRLYRERFGSVGMFENRVYDGIPDALDALKASGFRLSVVTSKPFKFALPILEHFGLCGYFESVHGSELSGVRSDKRELIAHVLRMDDVSCEHTIMIGDRSHDIVGARANDVRSRGVLWGFGTREELTEAGADGLYDSIAGLIAELT